MFESRLAELGNIVVSVKSLLTMVLLATAVVLEAVEACVVTLGVIGAKEVALAFVVVLVCVVAASVVVDPLVVDGGLVVGGTLAAALM